MMIRRIFLTFFLALALTVFDTPRPQAQDTSEQPSEDDDAGFLEGLIQSALGGPGRTVRISGLEGVLSSEARIGAIEVSDADGVWITVQDVALTWRRLALLRGRLDVEAMTVGVIDVVRPPLPAPADAEAEEEPTEETEASGPFSLPELPVSVDVRQLSIGGLRLQEGVAGYPIDLSVSGNARLQDGEGDLNLNIVRIDGREGSIKVGVGFENENRNLTVDLSVAEEADGLIATLAKIPGTPPLTLTVAGDAPISDFTADLALRTDDIDRLVGTFGLKEDPAPAGSEDATRIISADVHGDIADLFVPEYRSFFGRDVSLKLLANQHPNSGIEVSELDVQTQGLSLNGSVDLSPEFLPESAQLEARIGTPDGSPVVLPVPGPQILISEAVLDLSYDEASGDDFTVDLRASGIQRTDGLLLDAITLDADGALRKTGPTEIEGVAATIAAEVSGFSSTDQALSEAAGDGLTFSGDVDWTNGGDLILKAFDLVAEDVDVKGDATISGLQDSAIAADGKVVATVGDLSRFAMISGQDLTGAVAADLTAKYDVPTGFFDVTLKGQTDDLAIGDLDSRDLLAGQVTIDVAASRTEDGIDLSALELKGDALDIAGNASIGPDFWPRHAEIKGEVGLPSGAVELPIPGPEALLGGATLDVSYDMEAGDQFSAKISAKDFSRDDLSVDTVLVDASGSLDRAEGGSSISALMAQLKANVTGASTSDPKIDDILSPGVDLVGSVAWNLEEKTLDVTGLNFANGPTTVDGDVTVSDFAGDAMAFDGKVDITSGPLQRFAGLSGQPDLTGTVTARGTGSFSMADKHFAVDLVGDGSDLRTGIVDVDTLLAGSVRLVAKAKNDESGLTIQQADIATDEVTLKASGGTDGTITKVNIDGQVRDIGLLTQGLSGPLVLKGVAINQNETWGIDATIDGPGGSEIKASGDVVKPDGTMDVTASGALPLALANRILSPRSIEGDLGFDITLNGKPGLDALGGTITVNNTRISDPVTRLALEQLGANVTIANNQVEIDAGGNLSTGGRITLNGPIDLANNMNASLDLVLDKLKLEDPTLYDINLDGGISVNGPLTGGADIAGTINIGRSEIKIPSAFGGAGSIPDVIHIDEPESSLVTRIRAGLYEEDDDEATGDGGGGPVYNLDISINAPSQIFIRGRGLDVEMAGAIGIGGTTAKLITSGGLELVRGRLSLLAQRLDFSEATISLQGDLIPDIRLVASSDTGDILAQIIIEGPITEPEIELSSDPELPEDEVLAQLFFGKPISDLTPLEIAQLAAAINELSGGSGGVFGAIRDGLGVDDLNVSSDEEGTTEVTAGKYITDEIYTDVTFGSDGKTEIQLNYEIRKGFTARAGFDNEGNTGIGLVFEFDY